MRSEDALLGLLPGLGLSDGEVEREAGLPQAWVTKARKGANRGARAAGAWARLAAFLASRLGPGPVDAALGGAPEAAAADAAGAPDRDLLQLLAGSTDQLEIAKAATLLAARRLARLPPSSGLFDDLKRALEEVRRAEAGYLDLQRERGALIRRDVAKAVACRAGVLFVQALERLEARLGAQVERWLGDASFAASPGEQRAKTVRAWVAEQSLAVRSLTADEVERMVVEEEADQ